VKFRHSKVSLYETCNPSLFVRKTFQFIELLLIKFVVCSRIGSTLREARSLTVNGWRHTSPSEELEMEARYFNPSDRAEQKDASRREDARQLNAGFVSAWDLRNHNSMFANVDLSASSVILPANRY
jgi:hypothetical protein